MLAMMIGVSLTALGFVLMIGLTPSSDRVTGFIAFVTGGAGIISFFVFSILADKVFETIKQLSSSFRKK